MGYREKAIAAHGEACQRCGAEQDIVVHHRDRDRSNDDLDNLEVLCRPCHSKEHGGEFGEVWDDGELATLREMYPEKGPSIESLDRTRMAIMRKAWELGLSSPRGWSEEENRILRERYLEQGSDIPELNRTPAAIRERARQLGLKTKRGKQLWTQKRMGLVE